MFEIMRSSTVHATQSVASICHLISNSTVASCHSVATECQSFSLRFDTCHNILEHRPKTRKVRTVRTLQYQSHRMDFVAAQLFVDLCEILQSIVPEGDF